MNNELIKHHRGLCEINYCNLSYAIKEIKKSNPNLVIIDENFSKINPEIIENFSFISEP